MLDIKLSEIIPSLKLTWPLKIDTWKRRFLLETTIFRCELLVSGRVKVFPAFLYHLVPRIDGDRR